MKGNKGGRPPKYDWMPRAGRVIIDPQKLRYYREAKAWTRDELAFMLHVSQRSVRAYECGTWCPSNDVFKRMFVVLGIGPEDLLFDGSRYKKSREEGE